MNGTADVRRASHRRPVAGALVGALAAVAGLVAAVLVAAAARPDRTADEARNLAFLGTISHPTGAVLVRTETYRMYPAGDSFAEGFLNPSPGYATSQTHLLPQGATIESGVAFYRAELERHGWQVRVSVDCTGWTERNRACGRSVEAFEDGRYVAGVFVYRRADKRVLAST